MAYDKRFRERAIAFKATEVTFKQLRAVFGIDSKTYVALKLLRETGSVTPGYVCRTRRRKIDREALRAAVEKKPDATPAELAKPFGCSAGSVFYSLKKMGITLKKRRLYTPENWKKNDPDS